MGCPRPILKKETMHLGSCIDKAKMRLPLDSYLFIGLLNFYFLVLFSSLLAKKSIHSLSDAIWPILIRCQKHLQSFIVHPTKNTLEHCVVCMWEGRLKDCCEYHIWESRLPICPFLQIPYA